MKYQYAKPKANRNQYATLKKSGNISAETVESKQRPSESYLMMGIKMLLTRTTYITCFLMH